MIIFIYIFMNIAMLFSNGGNLPQFDRNSLVTLNSYASAYKKYGSNDGRSYLNKDNQQVFEEKSSKWDRFWSGLDFKLENQDCLSKNSYKKSNEPHKVITLLSASQANEILLKRVSEFFTNPKEQLPDVESSYMTGEEHLYAMLYDKLIDESGRKDVVILPFGIKNEPPQDIAFLADDVRFVISFCAVANNSHNTVLVIDRKNEEYYYFDSLRSTTRSELEDIIFKHQEFLLDFKYVPAKGTRQVNDCWSCGFHTVENAVRIVLGGNKAVNEESLNGSGLRNKYKQNFERFVERYHNISIEGEAIR